MEQLTIWNEPLNQDAHLMEEVRILKERQENLRRGIFRRFVELSKEVDSLSQEIRTLKGEPSGEILRPDGYMV